VLYFQWQQKPGFHLRQDLLEFVLAGILYPTLRLELLWWNVCDRRYQMPFLVHPFPYTHTYTHTCAYTVDWEIFVVMCDLFSHCLIFVTEHLYWQALNTSNALPCSSGFLKKTLCCCSSTMLTAILTNNRRQSGPVLASTMLTSNHALSCLPHLLIASVIAMAGIAEDSNPLGSGRSQTVYTCWCEIGLSFLLLVPWKIFAF